MTPEERDARLTAYALNDPGLTDADRTAVETRLRTDPTARATVDETRKLAQLMTTSLAAEQAALSADASVTIPSSLAKKPKADRIGWKPFITIAALLIVFGGLYAASNLFRQNDAPTMAQNASGEADAAVPQPVGTYSYSRFNPVDAGGVPGGKSGPPGQPTAPQGFNEAADLETQGFRGNYQRDNRPAEPAGLSTTGTPTTASPPPPPGLPPAGPAGRPGADDPGRFLPNDPVPNTQEQGGGVAERPSQNDRHPKLIENQFVKVEGLAALSTFGVDVDTASYAIVRKYLTMGQLPPANAVRLEELVNYFPYQDKAPDGDNPFAVTVELAECPWQPKHRLARIGVKAKPIATDKRPPSNLVFLIDVSGSMASANRLPLVKESLKMLVNQLGENDRVAMVVYAGASGLVLDSTSASQKGTILSALDRLGAGGSTNGAGGIQQAYAVAAANFIKNGTNRVILCTDGDWNVGTTGTPELVKMIEEKRKTGVFLSVFGFGMGNLRDEMLVQLAGKGNGNYGYIDTLKEANKALVEQLGGTLVTVAKDVKIQVEFNPKVVTAYRLLGYEKRALAAKDFHDDTKDAGEMGAGHVVTALYELVPSGVAAPAVPAAAKGEELRYQPTPALRPPAALGLDKSNESFVVKMRHKKPDSDVSTLRELPVTDPGKSYAEASEDFRFAAAVASFAMLLRDSPFKGQATYALTQELADAARKHDPSGYRAEFLEMIRQAKALSGKQ